MPCGFSRFDSSPGYHGWHAPFRLATLCSLSPVGRSPGNIFSAALCRLVVISGAFSLPTQLLLLVYFPVTYIGVRVNLLFVSLACALFHFGISFTMHVALSVAIQRLSVLRFHLQANSRCDFIRGACGISRCSFCRCHAMFYSLRWICFHPPD